MDSAVAELQAVDDFGLATNHNVIVDDPLHAPSYSGNFDQCDVWCKQMEEDTTRHWSDPAGNHVCSYSIFNGCNSGNDKGIFNACPMGYSECFQTCTGVAESASTTLGCHGIHCGNGSYTQNAHGWRYGQYGTCGGPSGSTNRTRCGGQGTLSYQGWGDTSGGGCGNAPCYCDAACIDLGDCCSDAGQCTEVVSVCEEESCPTTHSSGCKCDYGCVKRGDCCKGGPCGATTGGAPSGTTVALDVNVPATNGNGNTYWGSSELRKYNVWIPSGATDVSVTVTGGTGDPDLFVRRNAEPTRDLWDCRPWLSSGTDEACSNGSGGYTYYVTLHAYSNFSGWRLRVTYE